MTTWRTLATLLVALTATAAARAQTWTLKEEPLVGAHNQVKLTMALAGELKVQQEGKDGKLEIIPLKESATAAHEYVERILQAGADGAADKTARYYKTAKVVITVASGKSERSLRDERRFMIAQRGKDGVIVYCPRGTLTREELQLTEHFDTLAVTALLPGRAVAVGETWKLANPVAQALCHFEGLTAQDLVCKLEQVKDDTAVIAVTGTAAGIDLGAQVKVTVGGSARFDLKGRRLTALEWKQTDERDQGPASPASKVEIAWTLARTPVEPQDASEVGDYALVPVQADPPEALTLLAYADPKGRYELQHAREWQLAGRTDAHLVLRLMDRGEFVAQATLSPWQTTEPGKHLTGDEFREMISQTPEWVQEKVLEAEEVKGTTNGNWIYRVAAEGEMSGVEALQYFYLVAGPQGEQLLVAFTMTPAQAQKLGVRDLALLRGIAFPAAAPEEKR